MLTLSRAALAILLLVFAACSGGGGGGGGGGSPTLRPAPAAHKLTVLELTWTPEMPFIKGTMTVSFKVRNDGDVDVTDITALVQISQGTVGVLDTKHPSLAGSLAPGATSGILSAILTVRDIYHPPTQNRTSPGTTELRVDVEATRPTGTAKATGFGAADFFIQGAPKING